MGIGAGDEGSWVSDPGACDHTHTSRLKSAIVNVRRNVRSTMGRKV